ncbi:hypothetical protein ABT117_38105, partial [Streptomyces sp. NPDC002262]
MTTTGTPSDAGWEELVTSALLGTDRRPPSGARGAAAGGGPDGGAVADEPLVGGAGAVPDDQRLAGLV